MVLHTFLVLVARALAMEHHDAIRSGGSSAGVGTHHPDGQPAVDLPMVSVVVVDLLWQTLGAGGSPQTVNASLRRACQSGFTFVRFAGTPFWPLQASETLLLNATRYWEQMDGIVAMAQAYNCYLMPSLFWNEFLFADLHDEPLRQMLTNASSASQIASLQYVATFVQRYATNPTIAAWEVGNEFNLNADLNMSGATYVCAPGMGTPAFRTSADNHTTDDMIHYGSLVAAIIRTHDLLHRPISTGHAVPRAQAEHLRASYYNPWQDWGNDTVAELETNLVDVTSYADWMSVHVYPGAGMCRWNITDPYSTQLLRVISATAARGNTTLYVGEFGDATPGEGPFAMNVLALLSTSQRDGIGIATAWVWEFPSQNATYAIWPGQDDALIAAMQAVNSASTLALEDG